MSWASSRTSSVRAGWRVDLEVHHHLRAERLAKSHGSRETAVGRRVGRERRVLEVLGPNPEDDVGADVRLERVTGRERLVVERDRVRAGRGDEVPVRAAEPGLDHVHRRRADEAADEEVDGPVVELLRVGDLLELALAHHRDAVAHRHRLDLVVGDVDRRHAEVVLEPRDLRAHLDAELRVEVREGLVHEERLRLADDRAAHRDALALAAGERARLALEERLEVEDARGVLDAALDLVLRDLLDAEPEGDVLEDGEVRVERVALEDHRDVAIARRHVVHDAIADPEHAARDLLEARRPSGARSSCRSPRGRRGP